MRTKRLVVMLTTTAALLVAALVPAHRAMAELPPSPPDEAGAVEKIPDDLEAKLDDPGPLPVLVRLLPEAVSAGWTLDDVEQATEAEVTSRLSDTDLVISAEDRSEVDALVSQGIIALIEDDLPDQLPQDNNTVNQVGATTSWQVGALGDDQTIVIIDSGIDASHTAFQTPGGKILAEACFSAGRHCGTAHNLTQATGPGTATHYCPNGASPSCYHGSLVASAAAGYLPGAFGVAPHAYLAAIKVGAQAPGGGYAATTSDFAQALSYIANTLAPQLAAQGRPIASINYSFGDGVRNLGFCDTTFVVPYIQALAGMGIPTVISSGNNGFIDAVSGPGCVSSAVTVGAVLGYVSDADPRNDAVPDYANLGPQVDVLAPAQQIVASPWLGSSGLTVQGGTSMSAPVIAGTYALARDLRANAPAPAVESALHWRGQLIVTSRNGQTIARNRVNTPHVLERVDEALAVNPGTLNAITPMRILDTRIGLGGPVVPVSPSSSVDFNIALALGLNPADIGAVALNLTVVPREHGLTDIRLDAPDEWKPSSSGVDVGFTPYANAVWAKPDANGVLRIISLSGVADVLVDVSGAWGTASGYVDIPQQSFPIVGPVPDGGWFTLDPRGIGNVPASGVDAVVLNIRVDQQTSGGHFGVQPSALPLPTPTSNQNWATPRPRSALVLARLDAGGFRVYFQGAAGSSAVFYVDVLAYLTTGGQPVSVNPVRMADTRNGTGGVLGPLQSHQSFNIGAFGAAEVPRNARSVILNLVGIQPVGPSYLSAWPAGQAFPGVSVQNPAPGDIHANLAVVKLGAGQQVTLFQAGGPQHMIADVYGYAT